MSIDLGKLGYKVYLDDKQYREGMRQLLGETQKSSSEIKGIFSRLAAGAALGTVFFKSIGQARAFSKELANLKSIAWELDMAKVRKEILDLNATLGNSAELTNAMYFAYSAGVRGSEHELAQFVALAAELAQTVGSSVTPVMDAMTTMMNAYSLKVGDAANLTDWFYQIVKSGKTTGPELASSLGQIAATAAAANIPLDELGAALATLTTTMPTNIAVTSLAAAIRAITNPTEDARNSARGLGIDLSQTAIQVKGFSGVMQEIFDKTQGRADLIGKLFPAESSRAILSLAGTQLETFKNSLSDFENKAGNAKKGFDAILASDDKKWEAMLIILQKLGTVFGDLCFQVLTLGGLLNPVYSAINSMGSGTIKLVAQIGAFGAAMLGVAKAASLLQSLQGAVTKLAIDRGGYKTDAMIKKEGESHQQKSAALQAERESAIRIAAEKRVALAKANAAAEDAIRKQQEIISSHAVAETRVAAEQNARVQSVQTAQAVIVAEKTKELAVTRSVALQMALEKQRYFLELKNRARILPHLIAQKQQEIALATQAGTLTKEQTDSLIALQKEYAAIGRSIQKASAESIKSANAAKLARKAEIDGIAQANKNAQQKIAAARSAADRAIAESQNAATAQVVQQTDSLTALQKEYASIGTSIRKASQESVKYSNAAKQARKAEIDGIAQANRSAQQKISQAQQNAERAIAQSQNATSQAATAAAKSVRETTLQAQQATAAYHSARTAVRQAAAAQHAHNAAVTAGTAKVGLITGAMKGLWATIKANPIGIILTVATLAYSGIMALINSAEEQAQQKIEAANKLMEDAQNRRQKTEQQVQEDTPKLSRLEELAKKQSLTNTEMREAESLLNHLKVNWDGFGITLDRNTNRLQVQAKAFDELRKRMLQQRKIANIEEQKSVEKKKWSLEDQEQEKITKQTEQYITDYIHQQTRYHKFKPTEEQMQLDKDLGSVLSGQGFNLMNSNARSGPIQEAIRKLAAQRLSKNTEYQELDNRSRRLSAERKDILAGRDPEKERREQERIRNAQQETSRLEEQWKEGDLTDVDRRERIILKEFEAYKQSLEIQKAGKVITDEEYTKRLKSAELRKDSLIDENRLKREKEIALLAEQEKAWADGRLSTEEQIALRKKEIVHQEQILANLQKQIAGRDLSPERKRQLNMAIVKTRADIARNKGETQQMESDHKLEQSEKNHSLVMEQTRNRLAQDGVLSADDKIELQKLELTRQTAKIRELEERRANAATEEMRRQYAIQKAQAEFKKATLAEEIRQAEEKSKLDAAEQKRKADLLTLQLKHKQDGNISPEEQKAELDLKIRQQQELVNDLQNQERSLANQPGKEDLLSQVRNQRLMAQNALADLQIKQNRTDTQTQGSFSASVLGLMSGSPIEKQQLEQLKVMREDVRKLERQSRKKTSATNTYTA